MNDARNGYPEDAVWTSMGYWIALRGQRIVFGHRSIETTAELDPRLTVLLMQILGELAAKAVVAGGDLGGDPVAFISAAEALRSFKERQREDER